MTISRHGSPLPALLAVLSGLLGSCNPGSSTPGPRPNPIDAFVVSMPALPVLEPRDDDVPGEPFQSDGFEVVQHRRTVAIGEREYPILMPRAEVYPGADLQGSSLGDGFVDPITAPRAGGTIAISSHTGSHSTAYLDEVGLGTVSDAINDIILAQPANFPANLQFSFHRVRSREELALALGASFDYAGVFDVAANFNLRSRRDNEAVFVELRQIFYSIHFERPSLPSAFYAPGTELVALQPHMGPDNPPTYVDQVDYGRVFYMLIQSTDEYEQMAATLEANLSLGIYGGGLDAQFDYLTDFHDLDVQSYAYGGDAQATLSAILGGMGNWLTLKAELQTAAKLELALPLSFSVRSLSTDEIVQNAILADYSYEVATPLARPVPELIAPASDASLDNGCGFVADGVNWNFRWTPTPNTDLYELEVRRGNDLVHRDTTGLVSYEYRSSGARPRSGYRWRVRAHATWGQWMEPTAWRAFTLEAPNTDCLHTGATLFSHPDYAGGSITFEALGSRRRVDLERVNGWDDEIDSMRLYNCHVRLYEDPLREPWNGGANRLFTASTPDVQQQGFRRNSATVLEFDLGFPWEWLDL